MQVMTPTEKRRSAGHLFHEVNLVELANGPGLDNASWRTVRDLILPVTSLILDDSCARTKHVSVLSAVINVRSPICVWLCVGVCGDAVTNDVSL